MIYPFSEHKMKRSPGNDLEFESRRFPFPKFPRFPKGTLKYPYIGPMNGPNSIPNSEKLNEWKKIFENSNSKQKVLLLNKYFVGIDFDSFKYIADAWLVNIFLFQKKAQAHARNSMLDMDGMDMLKHVMENFKNVEILTIMDVAGRECGNVSCDGQNNQVSIC